MDQKLQIIMKANNKTRSLALPLPVLPSSLVGILPTKSIDEVDAVEALLSNNEDGLKNQEELVSINTISFFNAQTIIKCCINY